MTCIKCDKDSSMKTVSIWMRESVSGIRRFARLGYLCFPCINELKSTPLSPIELAEVDIREADRMKRITDRIMMHVVYSGSAMKTQDRRISARITAGVIPEKVQTVISILHEHRNTKAISALSHISDSIEIQKAVEVILRERK